jgi:hypothetical protein
MIPNINNNPDLEKAAKELDEEFPGAEYDYSLHKFLIRKNFKKRIIKKILFHGFFIRLLSLEFTFFSENTILIY